MSLANWKKLSSLSKHVIVLGTGPLWKEELSALSSREFISEILAVNRAIAACPVPVKHAFSIHKDLLDEQKNLRQDPWCSYHSLLPISSSTDFDFYWGINPRFTNINSGITAISIAQRLGYDKIYLAGIPMDNLTELERKQLIPYLDEVKNLLSNVIIPDSYWWKKFIVGA